MIDLSASASAPYLGRRRAAPPRRSRWRRAVTAGAWWLGLSSWGLSTWGLSLCGVLGCSRKDRSGTATSAASGRPAPSAPRTDVGVPAPKLAPLDPPPPTLGKLAIPDDNPMTPAKVELGRALFFDARLSVDGTRSCYSCHQDVDGTGGHEPLAIGAKSKQLTRHAPTLWNVGYLPALYWDGRSGSLEAQAKGAWSGGNMGVGEEGLAAKARELGEVPEYRATFAAAFAGESATPKHVTQALAAFERTLFCADTAWDRFAAGDHGAFNPEQRKGWELFMGKAGCGSCHAPPFFSDAYQAGGAAFHNTGVGVEGKQPDEVDVGRQKVTHEEADWASFKTPSLRNVSRSAPYFHDGSQATLQSAVRFMAQGGFRNEHRDPRLRDLHLGDKDLDALVAFLGTLECPGKLQRL